MKITTRKITTQDNKIKILILDSRKDKNKLVNGILWIHGGGYTRGIKETVFFSRALDILKNYETVIISPNYRLAKKNKYPKALNDCYETLKYIHDNAEELGIDKDKIMIGGESAGGGLTLATAIYARDKKEISVKAIFPLYPMIDANDTESSKNNKGKIWNTKKNHKGWKAYLGDLYYKDDIPEYASPAKIKNFKDLPPMYTFVCDKEPFYQETINFINKAKENKIDAKVDVYNSNIHAFDMIFPLMKISKEAKKEFLINYERIIKKYL